VAAHPDDADVVTGLGRFVCIDYRLLVYTELVLFQTGGNVGMGLRIDIRVDPKRYGSPFV